VSIRCNNPGAINGASWEQRCPGYVDTVETTPGNKTTIFEAPEYGVAVWWELLRRYAAANVRTVGGIINRYGGGQDYSNYIKFVAKMTGFDEQKEIQLDDDVVLLAFGKAMFHYEAGRENPLSDEQILYGLGLGRSDGIVADIAAAALAGVQPQDVTAFVAKKRSIIVIANQEFDTYHGINEGNEPLRTRIADYYEAGGGSRDLDPTRDENAWSAAFISFCVKQSGATASQFKFNLLHSVYVKEAIANADANRGELAPQIRTVR
jgi:hypothetical protein